MSLPVSVQTGVQTGAEGPDTSSPREVVRGIGQRLRTGELGSLPIIGALIVIWAVFQALNPHFLSSDNLVNLTMQSASTGVIALGVVLVLLVGHIDLSVGSVCGLSAALVAVGSVQLGWPVAVAVLVALAVGVVVGVLYGILATRLRLPSFVFTLAGLLVIAGLQLKVLGPTGSVNLPFESWLVRTVQQGFLPPAVAYALVIAVVVAYGAALVAERARRGRAGLPVSAPVAIVTRVALIGVALLATVAYLQTNRGLGVAFALFLGLVAVVDILLRRTRWGRGVHAVGGSVESARRAGVPVRRTYISVFVACSTLAALGGVLAVGRLSAANQGTGGGDLYLTAIAAAVIGGTSLFGGRGTAWSALWGVLIIHSINSGLTLLNMGASERYVITGIVLALAVTIDTLARRNRTA